MTPTPFRIRSHIIRIRNHPIVCTSLGGSLGGSAYSGFFQFGLMKLILFAFFLKHQEIITSRIQRTKGMLLKCHEYPSSYLFCIPYIVHHGKQNLISTSNFDIGLYKIGIRQWNEGVWPNQPDGVSTWACQKPPPWSPSQLKLRTIRTHTCSMVEGITSIAVTKIVVSGAAWAQNGNSAVLRF